jgi:hypothetical protein
LTHRPAWLRYGLSVSVTVAGCFIMATLLPHDGVLGILGPLTVWIMLAAYLLGPGPALLATVISVVLTDRLLFGEHRFLVDMTRAQTWRLGVFVVMGCLISWISARWRRQLGVFADREQKLRILLDRMPLVVWSTDSMLRLTGSSSAVEQLFGSIAKLLPDGHTPPADVEEFFLTDAPDFLPIVAQYSAAVEGESVSYDLDCGDRHYHVHVEPLRSPDGKTVTGGLGMAWDVTEQHRFERLAAQVQQELEQRVVQRTDELARANLILMQQIAQRKRVEQELRSVTRNARCLFWHADVEYEEGHVRGTEGAMPLHWNIRVADEEVAQQVLPLDVPAGQTYTHVWLDSRNPDDARNMSHVSDAAILSGNASYNQEYRCRDRVGHDRWLLETVSIHPRGPGKWYLVGVCTDVTLRKAAEAQREQLFREQGARAELEAANRAKDQFLATLSHELRTPMAPVLLTVSSLQDDARLPEEIRQSLQMIRRNVELEARLIDDLLDLTRISRGKLPLDERTVDAAELLAHARDVCAADAAAKGVNLVLDTAGANGHSLVRGDATRLQQVFWNLLRNAVKFTPPDGTVTARAATDAGGRLVVEVSDTGIGIEPELLPRIFQAFEQGGAQTTKQFGGLGLGLAISKALVELHGGTITAASAGRGQGATFTVTLHTINAPASEVAHPPAEIGMAAAPSSTERPLRILLVEDHADTRRATARLLNGIGHRVTTADCVAGGLEAADTGGPYDLLISDLGLPDGTGLDLIRQLRPRLNIPAIALSGFGMESDIQSSLDAGFDLHLTKPTTLERLESAIRELSSAEAPSHA